MYASCAYMSQIDLRRRRVINDFGTRRSTPMQSGGIRIRSLEKRH
jgi:hypothetical protein